MLPDDPLGAFWPLFLAWMALCLTARLVTLAALRRYRGGAQKYFPEGGASEIDPAASGSWFAFAAKVLGSAFFLALIRAVALRHEWWLFEATMGAFIVVAFQWNVGALHSLLLYGFAASGGVEGTLLYRRWARVRVFLFDLLCLAGLSALFFVLFGRPFFAGGAVGSAAFALYLARYAKIPR